MANAKKEPAEKFMLPEARLINNSLFEKSSYTDERGVEGKPAYKVELAFDPADLVGEGKIEDNVLDAIIAKWGDAAQDEFAAGVIHGPWLNGDRLAAEREAKSKNGDFYKGKLIVRSDTTFNAKGEDGPGGIFVAGPDGNELPFTDRGKVFNGTYGIAVINIACYEINTIKYVKFYLSGYQYTRDGEAIRSNAVAGMFKPVTAATSAVGTRRRRA